MRKSNPDILAICDNLLFGILLTLLNNFDTKTLFRFKAQAVLYL